MDEETEAQGYTERVCWDSEPGLSDSWATVILVLSRDGAVLMCLLPSSNAVRPGVPKKEHKIFRA